MTNPRAPLLDLTKLPNVWAASADALNLKVYADTIASESPHRALYIEAGRGCPFSCHFCAPAQFWDRRYRVKSPEQIAAEMAYLYDELDYDAFILVHDLLTVDPRFVRGLSKAIRDLNRPVRWMANSRTDLTQARDFEEMARAGCWRLFYGIDSGSARVQRSINKDLDPVEALEVVASASAQGVGTVCSFVVGHLDETDLELSESLLLGVRMKLVGAENVQFHRLRLFPPAPIATGAHLDKLLEGSTLDDTTLRLEYPLSEIAGEERAFIEANPRLYAGYYPPPSPSGSAEEISQIELFFTQAVAFAPLTVFVLGRLPVGNLVAQFRQHLERHGMIDRYLFDPSELNIVRNWSALKPRLEVMIEEVDLDASDRALLGGLLAYEDNRMRFVHRQARGTDAVVWQENEAITRASVAVDRVLQAAIAGGAPDATMLEELTVVFRREGDQVMLVR